MKLLSPLSATLLVPWACAVALLPVPATAQLSAVPGIPSSSLGKPSGPAQLDSTGSAGNLAVLPRGLSASRPLADRLRDHISIRDFLPAPACDGTTDDSPTVAAAMTAMAGTDRAVTVPGDCRLNIGPAARLAGNRIVLDGTGLVGEGGRDSGYPYGTRGSTVMLTDTAAPAFLAKRNWRLEHLSFFWPGQTEAAAVANNGTPVSMPALLAGASTSGSGGATPAGMAVAEVSSGRFSDNDVINAWDLLDFSGDPTGGLQVRGNRIFCLDACLKLSSMPVESFVSDNQFTPNAFFNAPGLGVGPTYTLRNWAAANASVVLAVGNGTATAQPSTHVDGLNMVNNVVFGLGYAFRLQGGWLNLLAATGNTFDGTAHVVSVEAGGLISSGRLSGGQWFSYTYNGTNVATPVLFSAAKAAPGNTLDVSGVTIPSASGSLLDWSAPGSQVMLTGVNALGLNNNGGSGTLPGVHFNVQGGRLQVVGSTILMQGSAPGPCIQVDLPVQSLVVVANQMIACGNPISIGGTYPSAASVTGNLSVGTHGTTAYTGAMAPYLMDLANTWDVPGPTWGQRFRASDGAYVFAFQGTDQFAIQPNGNIRARGTLTQSVTP